MTPKGELELELELEVELEPAGELELEPEGPTGPAGDELEIEPEQEPVHAPAADAPLPDPADVLPFPIVQVLPHDFPLPSLIRFVPDLKIKRALDSAVAYALTIDIPNGGNEALDKADAALTAIKDGIKAIEGHFEEPATIANDLHKSITGMRGRWVADAKAAEKTIGQRMFSEQRRLQAIEDDRRREEQQRLDAEARERAKQQAEAAKQEGAPAQVVEELAKAAETATAAPVPVAPAASATRRNSLVGTWKARIKGTPANDEPNPDMDQITPTQKLQILELMREVVAGNQPLTCFEINWKALNNRAKSEKATLEITGIEAFEDGGARAKGRRS